jgi:hypothetical protein
MTWPQKVACPACGTRYSGEPDFCSVCGNSYVGWATRPREGEGVLAGDAGGESSESLGDSQWTAPILPEELQSIVEAESKRAKEPGTMWLIVAVLVALVLAWMFPVVLP